MRLMLDPMTLPITIPLLAGLLCLLMPKGWERVRAWSVVAITFVTLSIVWNLFAKGEHSKVPGDWLALRVDTLSSFVLLATAVFALLIAIYSLDYMRGKDGQRIYYASFLWSLAFSCGALLADDLVLLLTCWGMLAVTLYLMIALTGPDASEAARKTLIMVGGSDALLLLGTALFWMQQGSTRMDAGPVTTNSSAGLIAFFCFAAAVFAKAGAIPLHTWLPDCGEKAYCPVTAFLPASLDKLLGIYLLAQKYDQNPQLVAPTVFASTLIGLMTIPIVLWGVNYFIV